jgi:hypothetical protein
MSSLDGEEGTPQKFLADIKYMQAKKLEHTLSKESISSDPYHWNTLTNGTSEYNPVMGKSMPAAAN